MKVKRNKGQDEEGTRAMTREKMKCNGQGDKGNGKVEGQETREKGKGKGIWATGKGKGGG